MADVKPLHPVTYSIFKPNILVNGDESQLKGVEWRVYSEILNDNHKANPGRLVYRIPYHLVFEGSTNISRNRKSLQKSIQSKAVFLDRHFMKKYMQRDYEQGITLFPTVRYLKECFEVELHPDFKKILTMTDLGFTKGDIMTVRGFKHDVSHAFYYQVRNIQSFKSIWVVSIDDFKKHLFIKGYDDVRNFKRRVIDPIYEDTVGTWVEFDKDVYVRGGRGNKIVGLEFRFVRGPKDEKDKPVGFHFDWEGPLKRLGCNDLWIKKIRSFVKSGRVSQAGDGGDIHWDSDYVVYSIEAAGIEYRQKNKDKHRVGVEDKPAWFAHGLVAGQWLAYANGKKEAALKASQPGLFDG